MTGWERMRHLGDGERNASGLIPHVTVLRGAGAGDVHRVLGREVVIGRQLGADVRIEHPTVSRRHARLLVSDREMLIEDLGSANGTLVGIRALRGPTLVRPGQVISIGNVVLLRVTYSTVPADAVSARRVELTDLAPCISGTRYFEEQIGIESQRAALHRKPFTVVTFRIETEEPSNEPTLEAVMTELVVVLCELMRPVDVLARTSPTELGVLLPGCRSQATTFSKVVRDWLDLCASASAFVIPARVTCAVSDGMPRRIASRELVCLRVGSSVP